jgi:DNA-binding response OmpR family regulator
MAKIVLMDDNKQNGNMIVTGVGSACHKVTWIKESYWQDAVKKFAEKAKKQKWDILILDINYPQDKQGGFWLFNELVRLKLRKKWRHTIVYSIYVTPGWQTSEDEKALALQGFTQSAGISPDCVLSSSDFDTATLTEKCDDLMRREKSSK